MSEPAGIPPISDGELARRAERARPIVTDREGRVHYVLLAPDQLRSIAFTQEPRLGEPASGLLELTRIVTLHQFGTPTVFQPSAAEVLAQIPQSLIGDVAAFECVESTVEIVTVAGQDYQRVQTILYRPH